MRLIWGLATEIKDLGVVAEQCRSCDRMTPCIVQTESEARHVFFLKMTAAPKETTCRCAVCGASFLCELWRYPDFVPAQEAAALSVENLLARTNPGLAERVQLKELVSGLGGDDRFATAYEQMEGIRSGELHAELLKQLLDWGGLEDEQRSRLVQKVGTHARAWRFARKVAPGFPGHAGCLSALVVALLVWSAFLVAFVLWAELLSVPFVRGWPWAVVTAVAGFGIAAFIRHLVQGRGVRRWTREVLVPEAQGANVSLLCFLAVVEDLPETRRHVLDDVWPIKDQLELIRRTLVADGRL